MRNHFSALFFWMWIWALGGMITFSASAQTSPVPTNARTAPKKTVVNMATPPSAVATPAAAEPPKKKSPIKLMYGMEYEGNNFGKSLTKLPDGTSAIIGHDFRVGYQVAAAHVIGIRETVTQLLETPPGEETFTANDWRIYLTWKNMIETSDVEMNGTLDILLPTSEASQKAQKLVSFNIKNSWTPKTQLRNWSFNVVTSVGPRFYQIPNKKTDLVLLAIPNITVDIGPQSHIYWELGLDATHKYEANYFDFTEGDGDYMTLGPQFDLNSHIQVYPALKFYTGNLSFKAATVYFNLTAAL